MPLRKPKGASRAARPLKDAGQTTVEYVVVIAIIIGLGAALTAFAATEKGSIADATSSVGNMFSQLSGPAGGGSGGGDEGAGGSGGAGAAGGAGAGAGSGHVGQLPSVDADAATWTLAQQKAVAEDISANRTSSAYYARAKAALDAGQTWTVELTDGSRMTYRIIGILHDQKVRDGDTIQDYIPYPDERDSGCLAGLTFQAVTPLPQRQVISATGKYVNWDENPVRSMLNSDSSIFPEEMANNFVTVFKSTGIMDGDLVITQDRVFLLSTDEYLDFNEGEVITKMANEDLVWPTGWGVRYEMAAYDFWKTQTAVPNRYRENWYELPTLSHLFDITKNDSGIACRNATQAEKSIGPGGAIADLDILNQDMLGYAVAGESLCILPAWCF